MTAESIDLAALRAGDEHAFRQLIRQYQNTLLAVVRPLVGDSQAEEVVQEAWIKVHRACSDFEGRSHIRTWLCSIALNEARMYLRRRKRETEMTVSSEDGGESLQDRFTASGYWSRPPTTWNADAPEELLMQDNLMDCLEKTLAALPENQQHLIQLRDIQGLPFDKICNELGISASNARVLLHRARSQLYQMLEGYQETGEC